MLKIIDLNYNGHPDKGPVNVSWTTVKDDKEGILEVSCMFGYRGNTPKNIHIFKDGKGIRLDTKTEVNICKEILKEIKRRVKNKINESQTMLYRVEVSGVNGAFKGIFVNQIEPTAIHSLLIQKMGVTITLDEVQQIVGELIANKVVNCDAYQIGIELKVFEANEFISCDDDFKNLEDEDLGVDDEIMNDNNSDVEVSVEDDDYINEGSSLSYAKFL